MKKIAAVVLGIIYIVIGSLITIWTMFYFIAPAFPMVTKITISHVFICLVLGTIGVGIFIRGTKLIDGKYKHAQQSGAVDAATDGPRH